MKDIYELLNDIQIDISDDDFAEVSEFDKKKLSHELKSKIVNKRKQKRLKKSLFATAIAIFIMSASIIGLSFPTYAMDVPLLGSIFKFFGHDGSYDGFEEQVENLKLVQESNGIKIAIIDAVFDGGTLFLTYTLETNKDLGDEPHPDSIPQFTNSIGGNVQISKVNERKYIGLMEISLPNQETLKDIDVNWHIESISTGRNNTGTLFKGNWEFDFRMTAVDSKKILVDQTIKLEDISVIVHDIKITPMTINLSYDSILRENILDKWDSSAVSIKLTDDLGNKYLDIKSGGSGNGVVMGEELMKWSATYGKLHPNATKLILTPIIELSNYETIGINKYGEPIKAQYRLLDSKAPAKEVKLEDIILEIK